MGIKEIARLAGVSIGTVDRVIHQRGRVSAETRKKIEEIMEQHHYRPNLLARSLKTMKRKTIALLIPLPEEDEYWQQAWEGFESQRTKAEQQGVFLKPFFYSLESRKLFTKLSAEILQTKPDGLIMAPNYLREGKRLYQQCTKASIPVIMFDTIPPATDPFCFIGTNSYQSGRLGAQLLSMISASTGKLAIFHFDEELHNSPHMIEKERGFTGYLNEEGRLNSSFVIQSRRNYEKRLESIFRKEQISGVFVSTSKTYLMGSFLKSRSIRNVKLVGFDLISKNIELMKEGYIDFLINQNPRRQAVKSLNTFINSLVFNEIVNKERLFPIEIITKVNLASYM